MLTINVLFKLILRFNLNFSFIKITGKYLTKASLFLSWNNYLFRHFISTFYSIN